MSNSTTSEYVRQLTESAFISRMNFDIALGPLKEYLDDPTTQDINVNPDGRVWVIQRGTGKFEAPEQMPEAKRETLISILANKQHRIIDRLHSRLSGDLPYYDVRFQCFAPPIGNWAICMRCHAANVRPLDTLSDMLPDEEFSIAKQAMTNASLGFIGEMKAAVARGDNIGVVGQPGSGKTHLLNSLLHEASLTRPTARLVTLEDRKELKPCHADHLQLYAKVEQANPDGTRYIYSFADLLADALRTSFDMLAFGELLDGESTVALLMALNCGTSGVAFTLHADSAFDAFSRLEDLIRNGKAPVIRRTIARFVNTLIHLEMDDQRRRKISEIMHVDGVDEQDEYLYRYVSRK